MSKHGFEKRRKGVELIFDIIFWVNLITLIGAVIFKVLYLLKVASADIITISNLVVYLIISLFMFFAAKLAHNGNVFAGILGILVAILEIIFAGILWKVVGVLLLIDSIMYLVNYKK